MADDVTFRVDGLNKLLRALEKLDDAAAESFKAAGIKVGQFVAVKARTEVPVRSGRLMGTIRPVATRRGAKIRAGSARVPYAGPIHFGWGRRNIAPNPFLYRAVDKSVNEASEMYLKEIFTIWNRNV
jgi:hypothetical protein